MTAKNNGKKKGCHLRQRSSIARQSEKDATYEATYREFVNGLSPLERQKLREQGLDKAEVSYSTHSPDMSGVMESIASPSPEALPSEEKKAGGDDVNEEVLRLLRMVLSNVFYPSPGRSREYELDIIGISIGMLGLHGVAAVARRHGVGRQAVSKAAVKFCKEAGVPPSVYMKSEANREKHRLANKRGRKRA
jgi:hypothetical protein